MKSVELPEVLQPFYFDFRWSQEKLWALPLSLEVMPVSEFEWLLDYPIWASDPPRAIFDLCPGDVIRKPQLFPEHRKRIDTAEIRFPIHIMFWKERWMIMDGFHRLAKLLDIGRTEVAVKKVPLSAIPILSP